VKVQTGAEATSDIFGCFCIIIFMRLSACPAKEKPKGNGINSRSGFMPEIFCVFNLQACNLCIKYYYANEKLSGFTS